MNAELKLYNSMTRQKELFKPLNPPFVGLYCCGQTVYKDIHIGNLRTMLSFDMIYRFLEHLGYQVRYVRNITDVGHLLGDADVNGEDKMNVQAKVEALEPMEIAHKYTMRFWDAMRLYNLATPNLEPTASGHVIEQIEMVQQIIDNGFAYEVNGSVYFDVMKFRESHSYGHLSGKIIEDLQSESRELDGTAEKKNPVDFVIWRHTPPEHITQWPSPWGPGVPGWHLECSVLSTKYLGEKFDIHGGGMDLKFPHHECEIAQNVGAKGVEPVSYWMHANMLTIEGQKMSKSLNNVYSPWDIVTGDHENLKRGFDPMVLRFAFLQTHYRSQLDFSHDAMEASEKGLKRLMKGYEELMAMKHNQGELDSELDKEISELNAGVLNEMLDDFNSPKALAKMFDLVSKINGFAAGHLDVNKIQGATFETLQGTFKSYIEDVFALSKPAVASGSADKMDGLMELIIGLRKSARANKDFETSDKIRDTLDELEIKLNDGREGTSWENK